MNSEGRALATFLTWLYRIVMAFGILAIRQAQDKGAKLTLENREMVTVMEAENAKRQDAFMLRTVDRWDKLQRDNPQLKVPKVDEPIEDSHLDDSKMERVK